ncbi:carboxylesterase [Vibrio sp. 10N.286.49.B3]|nr:carboxylesterase [Vibrio sp. 10N.286.49.B3]
MTTNELNLSLGKVVGTTQDSVTAFYDIPYAKNPFTSELRFKAPQTYGKWDNTLDATNIGLPVPQPSRGRNVELVGAPGDLTLNIWIPENSSAAIEKRPVMAWIPGGAFIREDAGEEVYNGTSFAQNDVIVVTINYRVGVDGFMHFKNAPDNRGILDQIMALEWIQDHIAEFGGDPDNVTLFGQSAGAESIAILLGTEKADGLFHRAIMQSPPMESLTKQEAERITLNFAQQLGVAATTDGIASVPFPELVSTVIDMGKTIQNRDDWGMISWGGTAFLPVVDNNIITGSPMKNLANHASKVPVIVGSTDQEARLYQVPSGAIDRVTKEQTDLFLKDLSLNGNPLAAYNQQNKEASIGDIFVNIQSDYTFRMPAVHIAEHLLNNGNEVWHFNFSWFSPAFGGRLGAAHFVDVPFVFNTIKSDEAKGFVGTEPPQSLADTMHNEWIQFAKFGTVSWTPYTLDTRPTMQFNNLSEQINDPGKATRKLWAKYDY